MNHLFLEYAKKIQSIAQTGLAFTTNPYDIDRYQQLKQISFDMMSDLSNTKVEEIAKLFENEQGYQTPKIDVRSVVYRDDKILLVKEIADNCWTMPGGWADIGYTPSEIAVKETWEESGLVVKPIRLLAVLDKKCHNHPPSPWYTYKIFILCEETGGSLNPGTETSDAGFFSISDLPPLSTDRVTFEQIEMVFSYREQIDKMAVCD